MSDASSNLAQSAQVQEHRATTTVADDLLMERLVEESFVSRGDATVAGRIGRVVGEPAGWPLALLALAIRAVREGSSALDLARVCATSAEQERGHEDDPEVDATRLGDVVTIPGAEALADVMRASALATRGIVHVEVSEPDVPGAASAGDAASALLVTLDRHYRDEVQVAQLVAARQHLLPPLGPDATRQASDAVGDMRLDDTQRRTITTVLTHPLSVLTGGPGMGKTYTLAAVIRAGRAALGDDLRLALAAPTGKAAARMTESLRENGLTPETAPDAITLHRLLGFDRTNGQRFVHNLSNPLPHDLVVIDEASMLSLALMTRLLEALKPAARLLLVGDADQLASVEAGSVLSDLVSGLDAGAVVRLTTHHRLNASRRDLALAFAEPDVDEQVTKVLAVLDEDGTDVTHIADGDATLEDLPHVVDAAWALRQAAVRGDADAALAALRHHRLLCAHRTGPYGVARWNRLVESALIDRGADIVPGRMYVGRPLIVTKNDPTLGLFNGDSGVVIEKEGRLVVLMDRGQSTASTAAKRTEFSPWRLADVETMHAMTVHKAQGSQAEHVTVIVPPVTSRLLTREMLYTALTRASDALTVVGTPESIAHAVRTPVRRASGLGARLRGARKGTEGSAIASP